MNIRIGKKWFVFFGISIGFILGNIATGALVELTNEEIAKRCLFQIMAVLCFCLVYDEE